MKKILLLLGFVLGFCVSNYAQVRIVLLGSSTVLGSSASPADSSLAGRLQDYYQQDMTVGNPDTVVQVVGGYGYTTYHELPTGTVVSIPGRPGIDPNANVTYALSLDPDVVLINLPSNDVATLAQPWTAPPYNITETMDNFRTMYAAFTGAGVPTYITTTQPRNDLNAAQRQLQSDLADSIITEFGPFAINFWDVLVTTDGSLGLRDDVRNIGFADADYHLNNTGHRLIYEEVLATNIFSNVILPLHMTAFTVTPRNGDAHLAWKTESEEGNSYFDIQRSANGTSFETLATVPATGNSPATYNWADEAPLRGRSFYRLRITEPSKLSYSRVVQFSQQAGGLLIQALAVQGDNLHVRINSDRDRAFSISVLNSVGAEIIRKMERCDAVSEVVQLSLAGFASGQYFVRITAGDVSDTKAFIKN